MAEKIWREARRVLRSVLRDKLVEACEELHLPRVVPNQSCWAALKSTLAKASAAAVHLQRVLRLLWLRLT